MQKQLNYLLVLLLLGLTACTDLDILPQDRQTPNAFFSDESNYEAALAKLYGGLSTTGQEGPSGAADISSIDEGFSQYLRLLWQLQELPTETAVIGWNDGTIRTLNEQTWTSQSEFSRAMYYRVFFQVSQANQFLLETTEEKMRERGIREGFFPTVAEYRAEARFLRALSYWHGIDLFGDVIFYTEENGIGSEPPAERSRSEVFEFIISELAEIEDQIPPYAEQEYGRASREAVNVLQAKLFQNAGVYTGNERHDEAVTALEKVLDSGAFALEEEYQHNFIADNHTSSELIWTVPFDGEATQGFGGTTFLIHAPYGGTMPFEEYGINGGWGGVRTTPQFVALFDGGADSDDERAIFYTDGQSLEIPNIAEFNNGYAMPKYQNVTRDGTPGQDPLFADADYPMFRLADVYLMYAESVLRGGNGDRGRALDLVNALRERAFDDELDNIEDGELTLDFLLDERGRELYWEGHRRTDRIRYGAFSGVGVWAWKGGNSAGSTTESFRDLYPIPATELLANPNLSQNDGY